MSLSNLVAATDHVRTFGTDSYGFHLVGCEHPYILGDNDTESGGAVPARPDQLPSPEYVAVPPLGVRGVAAPRRATPLAMAIRRIPRDDTASSGDGARRASRRPRKQATRRPLQALIHRPGPHVRRVATPSRRRRSAADCDKFDALDVNLPSSAVARHRFLHRTHVSEAVN